MDIIVSRICVCNIIMVSDGKSLLMIEFYVAVTCVRVVVLCARRTLFVAKVISLFKKTLCAGEIIENEKISTHSRL